MRNEPFTHYVLVFACFAPFSCREWSGYKNIGGVDDMAVWASFLWDRIARWMDNGPPQVILHHFYPLWGPFLPCF